MIDIRQLGNVLRQREGRHLEFKEKWYEGTAGGKASLAKDVLALANSTALGEESYLIIGVQDQKHGGRVVGLDEAPTSEAIAQILADYTTPPPITTYRSLPVEGRAIAVIEIIGSANRPHHAVRQVAGILEPTVVYVRRDDTNGVATSREVEGMLLERIGRSGPTIDTCPIRAGFVSHGSASDSRSLIARVTNVSDTIVSGIDVLIDLESILNSQIKARERLLGNLALNPRESREAEFSLGRPIFYHRYFHPQNPSKLEIAEIQNYGIHVGDRWLTVHLRVYYRDREGFLREIVHKLAIDSF